MWGFSKKRLFITLGGSIGVWLLSAVIQGYLTFAKYLGTFSSGCQVTGYPIDVCTLVGPNTPALPVILLNVAFWFWVIHLFWGWFEKQHH